MEDFQSYEETAYLMASPKNAERLNEAISQVEVEKCPTSRTDCRMILSWTDHAWDDYLYWQQTDEKILKLITLFIENIKPHPRQVKIGKLLRPHA